MDRRTACRTAAAGLLAGLAGCLGDEETDSEESTDDPQPDEPPSDTDMTNDDTTDPIDRIDSDRVAGATFTHTGGCSDPETAAVEFLDSGAEALITGCIEGRNGCAVPVLVDGSDNGSLRIEIGEVDFSGPDTVCTQEISRLGYELRLRFDGDPPTIEVFHEGAVDQGIVATTSPPS